jgi:uncharacterized protein (DUF305 family)
MRPITTGRCSWPRPNCAPGSAAKVKTIARKLLAAQQAKIRQLHRWKDAWS